MTPATVHPVLAPQFQLPVDAGNEILEIFSHSHSPLVNKISSASFLPVLSTVETSPVEAVSSESVLSSLPRSTCASALFSSAMCCQLS